MLSGHATAEGSARYRDRFPDLQDAGHFRDRDGLQLSSIGLGTYLGEPDDEADAEYTKAVTCALRSGINLLDTAINYRHQRSERNIGAALKSLVSSGGIRRDEVFVCTKAGYLSFDGNIPSDPRGYFLAEYVEPGILDPKQIAGGMHCMTPAYLENQIDRSRRNLQLETIDLFYIHNPESQLADVSREVFRQRLRDAFAMLEGRVRSGAVQFYGLATWGAFRVAEGARDHISLPETVELAREVGGERHHFRFIQLPFSLAMPEAYGLNNQTIGKVKMSVLAAASRLGIRVIGSAALYQGQLTHSLPDSVTRILGLKTAPENAIQFARSAPGMTASLVGMGHQEHVSANLKVALVPPCPETEWTKLFSQR
jgi:aryl-alcohol dehydrogenase-like predicted oxidoreductase